LFREAGKEKKKCVVLKVPWIPGAQGEHDSSHLSRTDFGSSWIWHLVIGA
jgi:hypothetical protein